MSEAPERILAECDFNDHFSPAKDDWTIGHWRVAGEPIHKEVEYVRADRLAAREAERDALREALLPFSQMAIRNGVEVVCDVVPKHVARARAALKGETP